MTKSQIGLSWLVGILLVCFVLVALTKGGDYKAYQERTLVNQYVDVEQRPRMNLKTKSNGDCIFLKENTCKIYSARPWQCQSFPQYWRIPELEALCPGVKEI